MSILCIFYPRCPYNTVLHNMTYVECTLIPLHGLGMSFPFEFLIQFRFEGLQPSCIGSGFTLTMCLTCWPQKYNWLRSPPQESKRTWGRENTTVTNNWFIWMRYLLNINGQTQTYSYKNMDTPTQLLVSREVLHVTLMSSEDVFILWPWLGMRKSVLQTTSQFIVPICHFELSYMSIFYTL